MSDQAANALFYLTLLILPVSALIARRMPLAPVLKMATAWLLIFIAGLLLVAQRERVAPAWQAIQRTLFGADGQAAGSQLTVPMAPDGHFRVDAAIDGVARRMLVDSGATTTALRTETARAAGISLDDSPFPIVVETANGAIQARSATIRRLTVGPIEVRDLPVVVSDRFDEDVLGMNFLRRLRAWRVDDRRLALTP